MLPLISAVSEIMAVLKNPIRLKILFFLSQRGRTYSELLREVTEDSGKFAFHLRSMKDFFVVEDGIYKLSPLGERLYTFLEGMEEVLMIVYAKPVLEIYVREDGSATATVEAEYVSPSRSILTDVLSFVGPAKSFIELFVEKKTSQMFGCKTTLHIKRLDFEEGKLKAQAQLEIEKYARNEGGFWKVHYAPSAIITEIQNVPWDVEGTVDITIHFPPASRLLKSVEDFNMTGEGYSILTKNIMEKDALKIHFLLSKKKGISIPNEILEMLFIDMEYEVRG